MRSLTRLAFGMVLTAAAPTASLLVMTYSHDAAAICTDPAGCPANGPALTGTRLEQHHGFPEAAEGRESTATPNMKGTASNGFTINGIRLNGMRVNGARMRDAAVIAAPSRLHLLHG